MIKQYMRYLYKTLFIVNLIYILIAFIIFRRAGVTLPFIRLEIGALLISLIISLAISIYRSEKGHPIINVIIAYLLVMPSLFIIRSNFGRLLFRSAWILYIIFIVIGIIYAIALWVASNKYKKEVDQLNALLEDDDKENKTPED
jgi:cbb3-type cytochrome oxidase subunit 3